jgi:recombination protein RecA
VQLSISKARSASTSPALTNGLWTTVVSAGVLKSELTNSLWTTWASVLKPELPNGLWTTGVLAGVVKSETPAGYEYFEWQSAPTGITALDDKVGYIPKSALTQIYTPHSISSGRTTLLCSLLAQFTDREELCALIDGRDCFDAKAAEAAGVDLSQVLWVRCGKKQRTSYGKNEEVDLEKKQRNLEKKQRRGHGEEQRTGHAEKHGARCEKKQEKSHEGKPETSYAGKPEASYVRKPGVGYEDRAVVREVNGAGKASVRPAEERRMKPLEQAFKAADILIQNGGFGLIAIDLGDVEERLVRKIPLTTWFRFARVIEKQPTALVVFATCPAAQSCAALTLQLKNAEAQWSTKAHAHGHTQFLAGLKCEVEIGRVRGHRRKPVQSSNVSFAATPAWK